MFRGACKYSDFVEYTWADVSIFPTCGCEPEYSDLYPSTHDQKLPIAIVTMIMLLYLNGGRSGGQFEDSSKGNKLGTNFTRYKQAFQYNACIAMVGDLLFFIEK